MTAPDTPFVATLAMRLAWPRRRARIDKYQIVAILVAVLLYGALFAILGWGAMFAPPPPPPPLEEIPVEIIQETPPPPPPAPTPESSPPPLRAAEPEYEKPATEAPRQGNNDKRDDESAADAKKPSGAPPPPSEATPIPTPSPAEAPAPVPEAPKAEDAELPEPVKAEPQKPPEKPAPAPKPAPSTPMFASIPEVDFGGAAMMAPVSGGNAKATYLTILYGLIVPRLHVPAIAHAYGRKLKGAIAFAVDGRGRLTTRWISQSSGSSELDAAAMEAVGAASAQFRPPPRGSPMGITFTYGVE